MVFIMQVLVAIVSVVIIFIIIVNSFQEAGHRDAIFITCLWV